MSICMCIQVSLCTSLSILLCAMTFICGMLCRVLLLACVAVRRLRVRVRVRVCARVRALRSHRVLPCSSCRFQALALFTLSPFSLHSLSVLLSLPLLSFFTLPLFSFLLLLLRHGISPLLHPLTQFLQPCLRTNTIPWNTPLLSPPCISRSAHLYTLPICCSLCLLMYLFTFPSCFRVLMRCFDWSKRIIRGEAHVPYE